ncbi:protein FD [Cinnamomum micranthum f. kanehirae]|uniref:Protein FD n=1 Tax=Cinnamomum micranthum f. kanehirae TaxID=337451 RepID=A0A3S3M918_9MAGN|nr:protein FD [Cinnamomum micranthum f. kanehirae]
MEEVWKDISLTSLQDHSTREEASKSSTSCFNGMILEDFLTGTSKETPPNTVIDHPDIAIGLFASTPPIPPPTALCLCSSSEFQYLDAMASHQGHCNAFDGVSSNTLFDSFRSLSEQKKKTQSGNSSKDRRHRRMIKNRESAARSRARKQAWAYTNELELEVASLMKENSNLKKQQEQLCAAASSAQLTQKRTLYRASTAPF